MNSSKLTLVPFQRFPDNAAVPDIGGDAPVLGKQGLGADVNRTTGRPLVDILEVAEMCADHRKRRHRQVHVGHAAHGVVEVGRVEDRNKGCGCRWNQRIGQQVIVEVLTIAAEA